MKEIANLAQIVTSRRVTVPPLLDFLLPEPSKELQLTQALAQGTATTLAALTRQLYGDTSARHTGLLRKLSSRTQRKLLNNLYFLDHTDPRLLVSRRYETDCLDQLHKAVLLYAEGEYVLSERLLRRCLREAEAGEFTDYALQAMKLLRNLYAEQRREPAFRAMAKRLQQLQKTYLLEMEAEAIYADTRLVLAQNVAARRAMLPQMPGLLARLDSLHRRANTFNTFICVYQLRIAYEEQQGNFAEMVRVATLAARNLLDGKLNKRRFDRRFNHYVLVLGYLHSRQPLEGLKKAVLYLKDFHTTSSNWLHFQETHLLLALHARQYEKARQLLKVCAESPTFGKLRKAARERWELYEAYLEFVLPAQRLSPAQRRRRERWTLVLPEFSSDKRGHNISLLVLQVLHYLRHGTVEDVATRLENLARYRQRYLREDYASRTRQFIGLLLLLPDKNFDATVLKARSRNPLRKLQDTPIPGGAYAETEIIPYENLWALVLQELRQLRWNEK